MIEKHQSNLFAPHPPPPHISPHPHTKQWNLITLQLQNFNYIIIVILIIKTKNIPIDILNGMNSVGFPAILPNLSIWTRQRAEITHFHHSTCKIRSKGRRIWTISVDYRICWTSIEELLVWVQKSFLALQVLKVIIVKCGRSAIKWSKIAIATTLRTVSLQWCCKCAIYIGIIINSVPESRAPSLPNCVTSCMKINIKYLSIRKKT